MNNASAAGQLATSPYKTLSSHDPKSKQNGMNKSPSRHSQCKCRHVIDRNDDCDDCRKPKKAHSPRNRPKSDEAGFPSPGKVHRKQLLSPTKAENSPPPTRTLEKSNSLTDSKPPKQLRTTKSLSPRPPVKHQHAITVSDEHNVVSLKVSPADDFDYVLSKNMTNEILISDSSPEGVVSGNLRLDDRHMNNRSTSCLVYVPSDPWTKMEPERPAKKKGGNRMKKLMDVKSLSKPDLIDDDPWVFDEARVKHKGDKCGTYRASHSKSFHVDSKSGTARPRLQRSKSPVFFPDDNPKNPPCTPKNQSPKDPLSSLSPKLGYSQVPPEKTSSSKSKKNKSQFLNVSNPNLLQPRHSFSGTRKDDELTLNIRRLSEQIKHSSNYASYGNFNTATNTPKPVEADKPADLPLETTC